MIVFSKRSIAAVMWAAIIVQCGGVDSENLAITAAARAVSVSVLANGGEQHASIHRAIRALEAAKTHMEGAAHDFCGHRADALTQSNLALNELGLAVACEKRRDRSISAAGSAAFKGRDSGAVEQPGALAVRSSIGLIPERHSSIRQAIRALEAAERDLKRTAHEYCGHRAQALEAVNRALAQLKLAIDCDKD